jgi:transposase
MFTVGLDVHWRRSSLEILNDNGKLDKRLTVHGSWQKLMQVIDEQIPRPFQISFEASCGYGYLHDELARRATRVVVGHPGHMRAIFQSKRKNDRIDAGKIAKLLYVDMIPPVHVPGVNIREWRGLIQTRRRLVEKRATCKNQVRSTLRSHGVQTPAKLGLWTKKGRAFLTTLEVPSAAQVILIVTLEQMDVLSKQIEIVEKALDRIGASHPGVQILMTIPGVGMRTAEAVMAYIDDVRRFSSLKCVGAYFGLVPCQDSSGAVNRLGHITRDGPSIVRKLLCEATHMAIRRSPTLRAWFERVMHDDPDRKKIAIVATAHHLVRVMTAMLRSGECWRHEKKRGQPRSTAADGCVLSPPEDTGPVTALSSDGRQNRVKP